MLTNTLLAILWSSVRTFLHQIPETSLMRILESNETSHYCQLLTICKKITSSAVDCPKT